MVIVTYVPAERIHFHPHTSAPGITSATRGLGGVTGAEGFMAVSFAFILLIRVDRLNACHSNILRAPTVSFSKPALWMGLSFYY